MAVPCRRNVDQAAESFSMPEVLDQASPGIEGDEEGGDHFGKALVGANLGKGGRADLAIGVPDENYDESTPGLDPPPIADAGAINVIYGYSDGLDSAGDQYWDQASDHLKNSAESSDHFGSVVA